MLPSAIALTEPNGMTGRHIRSLMERRGIRCIAVDRAAWDLREWREPEALDRICEGAQAIVHAGALVPAPGEAPPAKDLFDANVRACLCLGQWARMRNLPVVYISGATAYANPSRPRIVESDEMTVRTTGGLYGCSKHLGEMVLDHLGGEGLRLSVLRASSIYGTGMHPAKMISSFLQRAARGETIALAPPVEDRVNLAHAADVAAAALAAIEREGWDTLNVGGETAISVLEIAEACVAVAGKGKVEISAVPADREPIVRFDLNCDKAARAIGYRPSVTLRDGLRRMLAGTT